MKSNLDTLLKSGSNKEDEHVSIVKGKKTYCVGLFISIICFIRKGVL